MSVGAGTHLLEWTFTKREGAPLLAEAQLADILRGLARRMTILMVSHDLGFVSNLVEHVVCVNRRVVVHPTCEVTGERIEDLYGHEVRLVRHDDALDDRRAPRREEPQHG